VSSAPETPPVVDPAPAQVQLPHTVVHVISTRDEYLAAVEKIAAGQHAQ
jgi:hypothetical protein